MIEVKNLCKRFGPKAAVDGISFEVKKGERLPDEVFEKLAESMKQLLGDPEDVANAVLYAVTQPIHVNIADIVVRPPKHLAL